ncbi:pyridoxamine 5'-phosphate oxidase family protein [Mycobacterium sp. C31M]
MPQVRNLDRYGKAPVEWAEVSHQIGTGVSQVAGQGGPSRHTAWLAAVTPGGAPHVRPLGVVAHSGAWYFNSGTRTAKTRHLLRDGRCTLTLATDPFDQVLEGIAVRVTAGPELDSVAAVFAEDWPCRVEGDTLTAEFSAPSGGRPPYYLFRMDPVRVYAFGTREPYGANRFDL